MALPANATGALKIQRKNVAARPQCHGGDFDVTVLRFGGQRMLIYDQIRHRALVEIKQQRGRVLEMEM